MAKLWDFQSDYKVQDAGSLDYGRVPVGEFEHADKRALIPTSNSNSLKTGIMNSAANHDAVQIVNDKGYTYQEAVQATPEAVYPETTEEQRMKFNETFGFVPNFEVIGNWDNRDVSMAPGEYKAYNFTVWSNETNLFEYAILVYLSSCICSYPDILQNTADFTDYLSIYVSYDGEEFLSYDFEDGYFQDQNYANTAPLSTLIYIEAKPIQGFTPNRENSSDIYTLQVGFSVSDVPFQWDNSTFVSLIDADDGSALFQTGKFNTTASDGSNQTELTIARASAIKLQIFRNDGSTSFNGLTKSFCAVQRSNDDAVDESDIIGIFTNSSDSYRRRFSVSGLNESTVYVAYVTSDVGDVDEPGVVYKKIEFTTDTAGSCKLAYDLDFCDNVAYSVPQSLQFHQDNDHDALLKLYDDYAKSIYENFSKAMDQIDCYGNNDAVYSPIRSCDNCRETYKNWLCAMVLPKCTTLDEEPYVLREVNRSRSDFLNYVVQPPNEYYEVMPCIDMCYAIVRDCPSDFSFGCPTVNETILKSYAFSSGTNTVKTCNLIGNYDSLVTSGDS